jgi:hypothetical protein
VGVVRWSSVAIRTLHTTTTLNVLDARCEQRRSSAYIAHIIAVLIMNVYSPNTLYNCSARLHSGYNVAACADGLHTLCREVLLSNNRRLLLQYILHPPMANVDPKRLRDGQRRKSDITCTDDVSTCVYLSIIINKC